MHIDPSSKSLAENELNVFLSYASPDLDIAEKVEASLTAAGVRVFFAPKSILPGDNWIASIERALRQCQVMVLLLSPHSMPECKEVEHEWNYFDLKRKPIYPLLLQECQKHSRLLALNHIDAQTDLPGALERLLGKLRPGLEAIEKVQRPDPLAEYRRARIAEWSQDRYKLDHRFVNLTLTLDRPEDAQQRWHPVEAPPMKDLREVLERAKANPALVLLGDPGSGKSTLLRRLQLDHSQDRLADGADQVSFFIPLNEHKGAQPPRDWLATVWNDRYPRLPPLETLLQQGRMLLLLDALNEMQPRAGSYAELIEAWKSFTGQAARAGNRLIFSCRSRDIGAAELGGKELPVPLIYVQPMTADQVREFLNIYAGQHEARIWRELHGSKQFDLFRTPYFLKLLCEQVEATGELPTGRAGLFTGFVRRVLDREKEGALFQPGELLTTRDRQKIAGREWRDPFDLPERGKLIKKLSQLAFDVQKDGSEVSVDYDEACNLLADEHAESILKAGVELSLLDETPDEIKFFHQLLQEYFAARQLAREPNPALVRVEWASDKVRPALAETIAALADGDPLPPLPQTGWEETTLTAAPMAKDSAAFIRNLIEHNLPLAARCAAAPDGKLSPELKRELRTLLIERTQDPTADLRARIAAGEALGLIGDPRFERRHGKHGAYLLPPLVEIPGGTYPMGDDKSDYDFEKPAHTVELPDFQIGQFPVTNAEYKCFIEAGGYGDEQWWDTEESLAWLRGEASTEGQKESLRDLRKKLQESSEENIRALVKKNRATPEQAEAWIKIRSFTPDELDRWLDEEFPSNKCYCQPKLWDEVSFNNPAQPIVGITWFEARAYCNWLTANVAGEGMFRLPTEAEFEAATRGEQGRMFPYGRTFDVTKCNIFESHVRHTTPVGIFDNATPEGAFDLSGNTYTWTLSIYDQDKFPYPYRREDGREDILATGVCRVLRGGAWNFRHMCVRAIYRNNELPSFRLNSFGFRMVLCRPLLPNSIGAVREAQAYSNESASGAIGGILSSPSDGRMPLTA